MPWRERLPRFGRRRRRRRDLAASSRLPFVLIERRDLSPESSKLLAHVARHHTLIPLSGQRFSFRVAVKGAASASEAADRLVAELGELDSGWEEHFTRPRPFSGR